jgi:hypothetical protein
MAHGLAHQLQAVEAANYSQDAGGVGALLTPGLYQSHLAETIEYVLEKEPLGAAFQ